VFAGRSRQVRRAKRIHGGAGAFAIVDLRVGYEINDHWRAAVRAAFCSESTESCELKTRFATKPWFSQIEGEYSVVPWCARDCAMNELFHDRLQLSE
jgi:hypothetical protein